ELLGINYNNDPQSGNAINHLSGLGYLLVYDAVFNRISDKIGYLNLSNDTEVWNDATLVNGWTNYDATTFAKASYYKDNEKFVHLRGLLKNATKNSVIFTLPTGHRPSKDLIFVILSSDGTNDSIGRINIRANGDVHYDLSGGTTWVSLNGISFSTK